MAAVNFVFAQDASKLPSGYYIYMGPKPGATPPIGLTLNWDGSIVWQNNDKAPAQTEKPQPKSVPRENSSTPVSDDSVQWEIRNYPFIKWKAHHITTIPGGIAQLSTNYDDASFQSPLKCKLVLGKIAQIPNEVKVQLLDANGFKLIEVRIYGGSFHPVPGTIFVEANTDHYCNEQEYRKVRDYLVE